MKAVCYTAVWEATPIHARDTPNSQYTGSVGLHAWVCNRPRTLLLIMILPVYMPAAQY